MQRSAKRAGLRIQSVHSFVPIAASASRNPRVQFYAGLEFINGTSRVRVLSLDRIKYKRWNVGDVA
jgi:hypothetical protein